MNLNTVLFVSHDARPHGAQRILLTLIRHLATATGQRPMVLFKDGGSLIREFAAVSDVIYYSDLSKDVFSLDFDVIYSNTCANADIIDLVNYRRAPVITHLHELEYALMKYAGSKGLELIGRQSSLIIGCSQSVCSDARRLIPSRCNIELVYEFLDLNEIDRRLSTTSGGDCRESIGVGLNTKVVLASGVLDWRKGADLFLQAAAAFVSKYGDVISDVKFVWMGGGGDEDVIHFDSDVRRLNLERVVLRVGQVDNPYPLMGACDVFALCSREDPFPLVMLEACYLKKPVVSYPGAGGSDELVEVGAVAASANGSPAAFADSLFQELTSPVTGGEVARQLVIDRFSVQAIAPLILQHIDQIVEKSGQLQARQMRGSEHLQIFWPREDGYSQENSSLHLLGLSRWNKVRKQSDAQLNRGNVIRIDPLLCANMMLVARFEIWNSENGNCLWDFAKPEDALSLRTNSVCKLFWNDGMAVLLCTEDDPQLYVSLDGLEHPAVCELRMIVMPAPEGAQLAQAMKILSWHAEFGPIGPGADRSASPQFEVQRVRSPKAEMLQLLKESRLTQAQLVGELELLNQNLASGLKGAGGKLTAFSDLQLLRELRRFGSLPGEIASIANVASNVARLQGQLADENLGLRDKLQELRNSLQGVSDAVLKCLSHEEGAAAILASVSQQISLHIEAVEALSNCCNGSAKVQEEVRAVSYDSRSLIQHLIQSLESFGLKLHGEFLHFSECHGVMLRDEALSLRLKLEEEFVRLSNTQATAINDASATLRRDLGDECRTLLLAYFENIKSIVSEGGVSVNSSIAELRSVLTACESRTVDIYRQFQLAMSDLGHVKQGLAAMSSRQDSLLVIYENRTNELSTKLSNLTGQLVAVKDDLDGLAKINNGIGLLAAESGALGQSLASLVDLYKGSDTLRSQEALEFARRLSELDRKLSAFKEDVGSMADRLQVLQANILNDSRIQNGALEERLRDLASAQERGGAGIVELFTEIQKQSTYQQSLSADNRRSHEMIEKLTEAVGRLTEELRKQSAYAQRLDEELSLERARSKGLLDSAPWYARAYISSKLHRYN